MRPPPSTAILLVTCGVVSPRVVAAQQADSIRDTARVAAVVVTATRTPLSRDRVPASVTVLDGASLRDQGLTHVADALRLVPGIAVVQSGSYGAQTSLFMRGGQNNYTKVLLDGVPLNDPGGFIDLGTLTLENVERIEVVRGPTSVLYGSDAVTGVVQLFTRRSAVVPRVSFGVRGGTYGSYDVTGDAGGGLRSTHITVAAAHHASEGIYRFNSAYRNDVANAALSLIPWASAELHSTGRYADVKANFPTDFTGAPVDPNAFRTERRTMFGADLRQRLGQAALTLDLTSNLADLSTIDPPNDPADIGSSIQSRVIRQAADLRVEVPVVVGTSTTLGGMFERQRQSSPRASRRNAAAYVELLRNAGLTTITGGARVDHSSSFGDFGTYRLSIARLLPAAVRVRATLGTAFREPAFFETFDSPFSKANPALRPERTTTWEAGLEKSFAADRLKAGATYFSQRFLDLIDYHFSASGSTYENVARARAAGAEVELHATLAANVSLDMSYTRLDTRVLERGFSASPLATLREGGPLLRRPNHSASVGVAVGTHAGASVDIHATYVGEREDRRFHGAPTFATDAVKLSPYTKVDLAAVAPLAFVSRSLRPITVTLRIDNALATHYESVAGYATPGRVLLAGLRASF